MIEKESLTHRIEDDMERRNRNWDIIDAHLQNYTEQRQQDQLKVAKVEKELNDYKKVMSQVNVNHEATQKTSSYGIISLPKNAANGQVSVSVKGNTETDEEGNTKSTVSAIRLKSVGKNLFDKNKPPYKRYNVNVEDVSTGIKITTSDGAWRRARYKLKLKPNTRYTLSYDPEIIFGTNFVALRGGDGSTPLRNDTYASKVPFKTDYTGITYVELFATDMNAGAGEVIYNNLQLEHGETATEYEPYIEDRAYVTAVKDNKIVNLKSLPNGVADEIRLSEEKAIIRIGAKTNIASDTVINYTDMADGGQFVAYYEDGTQQVGIKGDTLTATATTLIYQLAEPEIIPIEASGNIVAHPNGTIYVEQATFSTGIYNDNMKVMCNDLPIKSINKIIKIDYETGVEHELDTLKAVISEDKLSFAHPDLTNGDIVFFDYEYDLESTHGETTVEFYDSRYTIKDSVTGKFYQWNVTVADGVPSIDLKEV